MTSEARLSLITSLADRCPDCDSRTTFEVRGWGYRLRCHCGPEGPWHECPYMAIIKWNQMVRGTSEVAA